MFWVISGLGHSFFASYPSYRSYATFSLRRLLAGTMVEEDFGDQVISFSSILYFGRLYGLGDIMAGALRAGSRYFGSSEIRGDVGQYGTATCISPSAISRLYDVHGLPRFFMLYGAFMSLHVPFGVTTIGSCSTS